MEQFTDLRRTVTVVWVWLLGVFPDKAGDAVIMGKVARKVDTRSIRFREKLPSGFHPQVASPTVPQVKGNWDTREGQVRRVR